MTKQTEAGSSSGGLLSKMVRFVKSPTTQWSDLERTADKNSGVSESRLALRAVMERKRQNDFVRNREFDQLRQLRRQGRKGSGSVTEIEPAAGAPADVPHNTAERARTLAKINSLEKLMVPTLGANGAQTKTKALPTVAAPVPANPGAPGSPALTKEQLQAFAPTLSVDQMLPPSAQPLRPAPVATPPKAAPAPAVHLDLPPVQAPAPATAPEAKTPQQLLGDVPVFNVEVLAAAKHDPELEEVAIRFANGDDAGVESGLKALLAEGGERHRDEDTWLTLFDFYRCTNQADKFEDAALDFVGLLGRSAPQWSVMSEDRSSAPGGLSASGTAKALGAFHWVSPVNLSVQSLNTLRATLQRSAPPWKLNWQPLKAIELDALPVLIELLTQWASTDVRLKFLGLSNLLDLLAEKSPTEDRTVDTRWWEARLALLRVVGEPDEFDLVALNYCVTYEVSPPAWEAPRNSFSEATDEGYTLIPSLLDDEDGAAPADSQPLLSTYGYEWDRHLGRLTLEGDFQGSAQAVLADLAAQEDATAFEINCRGLRRVDFGAAGDLLNWALEQQGKGHPVCFKHVNRLVAAFFGVVGIADAARVVLRVD